MKIGIICYLFMGGFGIIVIELGIKLVEWGYEVYFIILNILFRIRKLLLNMIFY